MKFDFGEWEVCDYMPEWDGEHDIAVRSKKKHKDCEMMYCAISGASGNFESHARLISKAPEMLKALIYLTESSCFNCPEGETFNKTNCKDCGIMNYIKLIESATNKTWEEINENN
jgi:hypothetical protein